MRLDYWLPQGVYDIKAFDLFTNLINLTNYKQIYLESI